MRNAQLRRAKRPRSIVAGPYGHPFHPVAVTIPIGAWVASLVFDLAALAGDDPELFSHGARWLIGIGIVGALIAALLGLLDLTQIAKGTKVFAIAITHMSLNLTVVALYAVNFLLRGGVSGDGGIDGWPVALSAFALCLLGASGWLGGQLAYKYGVRVAEERTQEQGFLPAKRR